MNNNKAFSMIALILTIVIIIILAAVTAPLLSNVMTDSTELDAKEEFSNVVSVVQSAKKDILIDRFVPNEEYLITESELRSKFGAVLTEEEIIKIRDDNADPTISLPLKYYLLDQDAFDDEFGTDYNITRMRESREYLVNYMDGLVVLNNDGKRLAQGNIEDVTQAVRGEIKVAFSPNGNAEWRTQQSTSVSIIYDPTTTTVNNAYGVWSESPSHPSDSEFTSGRALTVSGTIDDDGFIRARTTGVELTGKTGNGWYLWVRVEFLDDGQVRTEYVKSESFFIDNTPPTFDLEVS
ncbi:MAG: hypothetical protein IKR04_04520 [Clostridia bacterium]|nr:hypothetical protein [Clostridia bacterium]